MMTFAKILLGVDNRVMSCLLLHSDRAPFFGILLMIPLFQLSGIFHLSHMVLKSSCKMLVVVTASTLNSSALRRSLPSALWFFRELMAALISSFFGVPVSTLRSSSASGISGSSSGAGLLKTNLVLLGLFRGEELSLFISYRGISSATILFTDQFSDFIDISLLSHLCRFLCFLCQLFHICLFVSLIFLLTHLLVSVYAALSVWLILCHLSSSACASPR